MKRVILFVLFVWAGLLAAAEPGGQKRPMKIDDLFRFPRLSDPQISPDGKHVAYVVGTVDLEANKVRSSIWLATTDGKERRQLTNSGKNDRHPRWSPDSKHILFESNRSGSNQLWLIAIDGGEARQVTDIATGAATGIWSPDGQWIAFVSAVWPEFSDKPFQESNALNKKIMEQREKSPVKARVFTRLFFRHWDEYVEDKRLHLFVQPAFAGRAGDGSSAGPSLALPANGANPSLALPANGAGPSLALPANGARDVTPGDRDAYPTSMTFSVGDDFTFSPDSKYLVYTAPPEKDEAWSTNYDIWRVEVASAERKPPENLTKDNPAADGAPQFSPDGKRLAYRAQKRAGYEADLWELMTVPTNLQGAWQARPQGLTASSDLSVDGFVWGGNDSLYFLAERQGTRAIFEVGVKGGKVEGGGSEGVIGSLSAAKSGTPLAYTWAYLNQPPEVFAGRPPRPTADQVRNLSQAGARLLAELDLPRPESVTVPGAGGTPMQMWILKPPGFDPKKKWPVVYLVHGGPQGAWEDGWSYRWNPELWAAQGYVVALPNPRGSTGFGQKYVDEISGDWGGKCFQDLMKGVDYLETLPYVDKDRIASAGASFGGYMMNWFAVNTGRFKCLITHCSVWNFDSMYATTDELWFDEWEHGGPPWGNNRLSYEKHSPHRLAQNLGKFKTPMLVIHNDLDFRCPIGQGHELFTSLQRQGVPARMINFPDEGHWVLKPQNSQYWHQEVFAWLTKYVPPGGR